VRLWLRVASATMFFKVGLNSGDISPRKRSMRKVLALALTVAVTAVAPVPAQMAKSVPRGNPPGEWRYWGADAWSSRYSPLDQINASNFNSLQIAWQWSPGGEDEYFRSTPLYANGKIYSVGRQERYAYAIDPATGKEIWRWGMEEGIRFQKAPRPYSGRGLAYWTDGTNERIILVTPGYHMASIDAKTGLLDKSFGKDGIVDLMDGLGYMMVKLAVDDTLALAYSDGFPYREAKPGETWNAATRTGADGSVGILGQIGASSPAIMVGDMIVVGNSHVHGYYPIRLAANHSFIRGFDIKTGRQVWKFNLIPQPNEFGADTWERGTLLGTPGTGKVDAWAPYSADPEAGIVYIPVGMPIMDEYGGHRPGANLFGTSIVALDASTGTRKWHFQFVHHDIWDYDTPMAPNLLDINVGGRTVKAVAQTTKQGWIYTFDRITGKPVWPIPEKQVMQSDVPGEKSWPTQPIPSKPAPFSQQGLVEADIIDYTTAIKDSAMKLAKRCRMGPYFIPPVHAKGTTGYTCSWYAPGASGGVNIDGGAAVDVETGMMYVGSQSGMATIQVQKDPCSEFDFSSPHDACSQGGALPPPPGYTPPQRAQGDGFTGRAAGAQINGVSIVKVKEYGGLTGYDMNTGDKRFWIANGGYLAPRRDTSGLFAGVNLPLRPSGGQAQVITTKSLVIYGTGRNGRVGANQPNTHLFAVDKATGKEVGKVQIPAVTTAVPMTYMHQGKQYIVFAIGGGTSTRLVALTLPK
jgi:quinoprotein glucose dehydrogenase